MAASTPQDVSNVAATGVAMAAPMTNRPEGATSMARTGAQGVLSDVPAAGHGTPSYTTTC